MDLEIVNLLYFVEIRNKKEVNWEKLKKFEKCDGEKETIFVKKERTEKGFLRYKKQIFLLIELMLTLI